MAKHKYDAAVTVAKKMAKERIITDTAKKTTVKDLAEKVDDLEKAIGIK
jgi:hypothetical protein